jgi:hypothetical protein
MLSFIVCFRDGRILNWQGKQNGFHVSAKSLLCLLRAPEDFAEERIQLGPSRRIQGRSCGIQVFTPHRELVNLDLVPGWASHPGAEDRGGLFG